jgi:CubicO group peptidase (beta-lactamase class C family)
MMVATAGYLAGELTDQSWSQLVKNKIFTPLGMSNTFTSPSDVMARGNFAQPYVTQGFDIYIALLSNE